MVVRYKFDSNGPDGDLVCAVTEFMDDYLLCGRNARDYCCTYLYNDLTAHSSPNLLQIAFRYPGATRGTFILKRLSSHRFQIMGIYFNYDMCFGDYAIYDRELEKDIDLFIGKILDFSKVTLVNNGTEFTY